MKHYLGLCLVLITVAAIALFAVQRCTDATGRTLAQVRDAFAGVLQVQPKITVNERVIQTQTAPIAELAVVTREELVTLGLDEHEEFWSHPIPLTGKKLTVEATYRLKAGFDLREPFSVAINPETKRITAILPSSKILSVEQVGDLSFHGEDSLLNRLTDDERAQLVNNLAATARKAAESSSLRQDAADQVRTRLEQILAHNGQSIEIEWSSPVAIKAPLSP